ncbi:MAG: hypothetical protein K0U64_03720 [Actinomycetia bacterium]|nr:hypothetical protein [Actinomycetes bacterium]
MAPTPDSVYRYLSAREAGPESTDLANAEREAVRELLIALARAAPGRSVELRVPPYGATQLIQGPRHRRGTPSATVELDATTLISLCLGELAWGDAVAQGRVWASGERADLTEVLAGLALTDET